LHHNERQFLPETEGLVDEITHWVASNLYQSLRGGDEAALRPDIHILPQRLSDITPDAEQLISSARRR